MTTHGSCAPYDLSIFDTRSSSLFAALRCHHSLSVSHMTPGEKPICQVLEALFHKLSAETVTHVYASTETSRVCT